MALSGVRSSWLMLAMNSLLARFAASAWPRASSASRRALNRGGEFRVLQWRGHLIGERREQPLVVGAHFGAWPSHHRHQSDHASLHYERHAEEPFGRAEETVKAADQ